MYTEFQIIFYFPNTLLRKESIVILKKFDFEILAYLYVLRYPKFIYVIFTVMCMWKSSGVTVNFSLTKKIYGLMHLYAKEALKVILIVRKILPLFFEKNASLYTVCVSNTETIHLKIVHS